MLDILAEPQGPDLAGELLHVGGPGDPQNKIKAHCALCLHAGAMGVLPSLCVVQVLQSPRWGHLWGWPVRRPTESVGGRRSLGPTGECAPNARVLASFLRGLPPRVIVPRGGCAVGGHWSQGGIVAVKVCLAGCGGGVQSAPAVAQPARGSVPGCWAACGLLVSAGTGGTAGGKSAARCAAETVVASAFVTTICSVCREPAPSQLSCAASPVASAPVFSVELQRRGLAVLPTVRASMLVSWLRASGGA